MEFWGLDEADFSATSQPLALWPETLPPLRVFAALSTQWRVGFGGATGLDYGVLPTTLRLLGVPRAEWPELFADIRTMERAALDVMHQQANKEA